MVRLKPPRMSFQHTLVAHQLAKMETRPITRSAPDTNASGEVKSVEVSV